jgi:uroporphyrinogen-III synthase
MKVKTILVSQPEPTTENSPYYELSEKQKVKIDFRSFIHIEEVEAKDVRTQKIELKNYTAVILTSRNAVDNFFRIAEEMRFKVPQDMKYFCLSEAVAFYLQRYIVYRKRKIYIGEKNFCDLMKVIKKHKDEYYLLPATDKLQDSIPKDLNESGVKWDKAILYKTVISDLTDLENVFYDILVFFSPSGIDSLYHNFPDFKQNNTRIAVFGNTTVEAATARGLKCNIIAPTPETPSMTMALEKYIIEVNKNNPKEILEKTE